MGDYMAGTSLPKPDHATPNMRLVGHSDQGGRSDGVQIMVHEGYAYVGHIFSKGFSVLDVRDPANPKTVKFVPAPPDTWTLHLQVADNLLLVIHNKDMFAQAELADEKAYYKGSVDHHAKDEAGRNWSAGMAVYDVSRPGDPKQIGFMPVEGTGLHRIWYSGGRWAYASALLDGFSDYIFITIDMADPTRPQLTGHYALPGMNLAAGETPNWPAQEGRYGLHHPIVRDDVAYCSWRDACLVVVDVKDKARPQLITRKIWAPPFGGGTHNALPLPVATSSWWSTKRCWTIRRTGSSRSGSSTTRSSRTRSASRPFRPHPTRTTSRSAATSGRTTSTRTGPAVSSAKSSSLRPIRTPACGCTTSAISSGRPTVGAFVPPPPAHWVDPRPNRPIVLHSADVFVDRNALCYVTDFNAGLYIVEYRG